MSNYMCEHAHPGYSKWVLSKITILFNSSLYFTCPLKVAYAKHFIVICSTINPEYIQFSYNVCEMVSLPRCLLIKRGNQIIDSLTLLPLNIPQNKQTQKAVKENARVVVSSQWRFWQRDPGFAGHYSSCTECDRPEGSSLDPLLQTIEATHTPATQSQQ